MNFIHRSVVVVSFLVAAVSGHAIIGVGLQDQLGNPTAATTDPSNHTHYYIGDRPQYALDYNDTLRVPNWVAWNLTTADLGSTSRSPNFFVDTSLPAGFTQVQTNAYSNTGYDRGHHTPSADRTLTRADNDATFLMTNIVPQSPDNNQGPWASFENYCRSLANAGNEILIVMGSSGFAGSTLPSGVAIPGYTWKIAVVVPVGPGTAVDRITASTRIITLKVPNVGGIRNTPWQNFVTSVAQIETDTGYTFLTALPPAIASALRPVVDGASPAGAPSIAAHPGPQTTVVGGSATFTVTANGDAPLQYQWFRDDDEIPGATSDTLALTNIQAADVGNYFVVVTNAIGSATSNPAALIVLGLPPVVVTPPASQTVSAGTNVTFSVTVSGSPTLTYQWRRGSSPISGATGASFTLANVQAADAGSYDVVVTNSVDSATSASAILVVNDAAPTITGQPAPRVVTLGENASFTVVATGTTPLSYAWRKGGNPLANGGNVSGATSPTLLLTGVSAIDAGNYDVVVSNTLGDATSGQASLTVNPPPPSTVAWTFGPSGAPTAEPTSGLTVDLTGGTLTRGNNNGTTDLLTTTSASPTSTFSGAHNAGAAARIGPLNQGSGGSAYFEFTLAPSAGKRLLATGISFGMRSTGTGPKAFAVFTSLDGFTTAVASGPLLSDSTWRLQTPGFTTVTGATGAPITFRIYGYDGTGSPGTGVANWRMDDLKLTVNAVFPPPVPPEVIATTPAAGATNVPVTNPITITFNEAVSFTGTWFSIQSASQGPIAAAVTGGPTTFTLTPPSAFPFNDAINVTIFGAHVVDQASGTMPGTTNTVFSFTTSVYVPPTPPMVTTQPLPQTVPAGANASFTVAASGTAPLTYQWRKGGAAIAGNTSASTPTLTLLSVSPGDAGNYDCLVTNVAGSDVSQIAVLTVTIVPPAIATQPVAQMVAEGGNAAFTVTATGTEPLGYQWRRNGAPLADGPIVSGAQTPTLTLSGVTHAESGSYDVVVSNSAGSATSAAAALAVTSADPATIYWNFGTAAPASGIPAEVTGGTVAQGNNNGTTTLLTSTSVSSGYSGASGGNNAGAAARTGPLNRNAGGSAYFEFTFTPSAGRRFAASAISFGLRSTGTGPQAFALYSSVDGYASPLAGGTVPNNSAWLLYAPAFRGVLGGIGEPVTFRLYGYNGTGSPGTGTANWRIDDLKLTAGVLLLPPVPPEITEPPLALTRTVGESASFSVVATGTAPLAYQWLKNTSPLAGATDATLSLTNLTTADAGNYSVIVSNVAGSATSPEATLTVNKAIATVSLADLTHLYDGTPKAATATADPAGLPVLLTYDGSPTPPTYPGLYAVVATVVHPNYAGATNGTLSISIGALVRHAPTIHGGVTGSVQVLSAENVSLSGNAWISGNLLVPGTPQVQLNGSPIYGGTQDAGGSAQPSHHTVTLAGNAVLSHVVRRVDAIDLPQVAPPNAPNGTRSVTLNTPNQDPGDWSTIRDLTLAGNAGAVAVPPGAYRNIVVTARNRLVLGVAGATEPAVYDLQGLNVNGGGQLQVVGPVVMTLSGSVILRGDAGEPGASHWLQVNHSPAPLQAAVGGVMLDGNATLHGSVTAPGGVVTLNGSATLNGRVIADRLVIAGNAELNQQAP